MAARKVIKKALIARSGVGQSSVSQIISGVRSPSREMVQRLARGLANPGELQAVTDAGLLAAGFSTGEYRYPDFRPLHSIIREIGYDESVFTEGDLTEMQSGVETLIEGFAAKKRRQLQFQGGGRQSQKQSQ